MKNLSFLSLMSRFTTAGTTSSKEDSAFIFNANIYLPGTDVPSIHYLSRDPIKSRDAFAQDEMMQLERADEYSCMLL